jgi:hypothetical protein
MTDRLDDLLHQAGRAYAAAPPAHGPRPDDVERRGRARRRNRRAATGAFAALVLVGGAAALTQPVDNAFDRVTSGDADRAATSTATPTGPSTTTVAPTTTGAVVAVPGPTAPRPTLPATTTTAAPADVHRYDFGGQATMPLATCPNFPDDDPPTIPVVPSTSTAGGRAVSVVAVAYQDLDGDGGDEAVVSVRCRGGAHEPHYAWVYRAGGPAGVTRVAGVEPDAATMASLTATYGITGYELRGPVSVEAGQVISDSRGSKADDLGCCATYQHVVLRHRLQGTNLVSSVVSVSPPENTSG